MEMIYNRITKRSFVLYVALQLRMICLEFARVQVSRAIRLLHLSLMLKCTFTLKKMIFIGMDPFASIMVEVT